MEHEPPDRRRIVVDGSNIATEGRTLPSLAQLDEAIRTFLEEYKGFTTSDVTVVVDASFGHRIDPSEVPAFEQALEHGEMITPPAGAVGRGDGFILRIAEKSGALVLSNDSFQEFHAERPWLFEPGRLIGGKPVPGVGWIFTPRTPVRGAKSRAVTGKSRRDKAAGAEAVEAGGATDDPDAVAAPARRRGGRGTRSGAAAPIDERADGTADQEDGEPTVTGPAKRTKATAAVKAAKVTKTTKTTKTTKKASKASTASPPKAAKAANGSAGTKATKATKKTKPDKTAAARTAKAAEPDKAKKATKAAKATKVAKKADKDRKPVGAGARAAKGTTGARGPATTRSGSDGDGSADGQTGSHEALNDPLTFLTFVADHPVGSVFDGTVVSFTSHGAHVEVEGMLCHVPLRGLGDPPPNRARQVLSKGETRPFVLVSLDAARRRAELALPGAGR